MTTRDVRKREKASMSLLDVYAWHWTKRRLWWVPFVGFALGLIAGLVRP